MRWRWLTVSLWLLAACGLAWICAAVATYTGLGGGPVTGCLCAVAVIWGFLLKGYDKDGRFLAAVFQTTVSSGTVSALAVVATWPLLNAWQDQGTGPAAQWMLPIAGAALAGLILALILIRWLQILPPELRLSGGFPEARAVAGLFVNNWSDSGGIAPGGFWRSVLAGGVAKAIVYFGGGTGIGPAFLGLGALVHRQAAQALLAGALVSRFAIAPLSGALSGLPVERSAVGGAAAGFGALIAVICLSILRSTGVRLRPGLISLTASLAAVIAAGGWWLGGSTGAIAILAGVLGAFVLAFLLIAVTGTSVLGLVMLGSLFAPALAVRLLAKDLPTPTAVTVASLSCVVGFFVADFFQTVRVNAHLAGASAPTAGVTAWLKALGTVAGLGGAFWAAGVVADGAVLGSAAFTAREAAVVSRTLSLVVGGRFPLELIGAGAALGLTAELLGRRGWLLAAGMLLPLPPAILLAVGAWLADCREPERVRPAVASGLIAGDLLAQGVVVFGVGWGLISARRVAWNPMVVGMVLGALLLYLVMEHRAGPSADLSNKART